jgi:DNA repair protein RadD
VISLYDDQEAFIQQIRSLWKANKRMVGYMPTGGGKTRCAAKIIEGMISRGLRVCFTVPRISLIQQTVDSFEDLGLEGLTVMHGKSDFNPSAKIIVASVDTMIRRKKLANVDLFIIDEAHKRRKKLLEWMAEFPNERYIGLTATPFPKWMGEYYTAMAKGPSMAVLIDTGRLAPYDVYAPDVPDLTGAKTTYTGDEPDFAEESLAKIMGDAKLVGNVVSNWLENGENRQTIALAVNVLHANQMANEFAKAGISVEVITAKTPLEEREVIFKNFRSRVVKILLSVDCLTEGADFPECNCLINARPTKSKSRYIQGFGRVLRFMEGKRALIFDHSGTTLILGLPCDIEIEGLNSGDEGLDENTQQQAKEKPEKIPKLCRGPGCTYLKPAGVHTCPICGFTPRAGQDVETAAEIGLKKLGKKEKKETFTKEDKQKFYSQLIGWKMQKAATKKPVSESKVKAVYRRKFGVWPNGLSLAPEAPSTETLNYVTSCNIYWAKSLGGKK